MDEKPDAGAATLLREARMHAGLTQRQVAHRAGVSQPVVAAYESGRRQPTLPMLRKLLAASGHTVEIGLRPSRTLPDPDRAGRVLVQVLELAERLPRRRRPPALDFPPLRAA